MMRSTARRRTRKIDSKSLLTLLDAKSSLNLALLRIRICFATNEERQPVSKCRRTIKQSIPHSHHGKRNATWERSSSRSFQLVNLRPSQWNRSWYNVSIPSRKAVIRLSMRTIFVWENEEIPNVTFRMLHHIVQLLNVKCDSTIIIMKWRSRKAAACAESRSRFPVNLKSCATDHVHSSGPLGDRMLCMFV